MGSVKDTRTLLLYVNKGKLLQYIDKGTEPIVHEAWEGYLTGISFKNIPENVEKKTKAYEALNIHIDDGNEKATITCSFATGYGRAFAKIIGNADLSQPITIKPDYKDDGSIKIGGMIIKQHGQALKWKFKKDDMGGCPVPKEHLINGNKVVDYTEQTIFLKDFLLNTIVSKLQAPPASAHPLMTGSSDIQEAAGRMDTTPRMIPQSPEDLIEPVDDLPF